MIAADSADVNGSALNFNTAVHCGVIGGSEVCAD